MDTTTTQQLSAANQPLRFFASALGARTDCNLCPLAGLCLPAGLDESERSELARLLIGRRRVRAGQDLCREGDALHSLYALRAGSFKAVMLIPDGRELVTSFFMTGDVMGLDALADQCHPTTLTALEDGEVCAIPYQQWLDVSGGNHGGLRARMHTMLSVELARERRLKLLLTQSHAEPRVAAFLLMMSARMQARGYSATEFRLRMSRADIGSYLGLTLETVSRTLSSFDERGWTLIRKKRVSLLDPQSLRAVCEMRLPGTHVGTPVSVAPIAAIAPSAPHEARRRHAA